MAQPAVATGRNVTDLTQWPGMRQMKEEHGDEVAPACRSLRAALHTVFTDKPVEGIAGNVLGHLFEEVRHICHEFVSVFGLGCVLRKSI